jgi:hypothetical protein
MPHRKKVPTREVVVRLQVERVRLGHTGSFCRRDQKELPVRIGTFLRYRRKFLTVAPENSSDKRLQ